MGKVVIFGGTGLIGKELTEVLNIHEYIVTIVSRDIEKAKIDFANSEYKDLINFLDINDDVAVIQAMNKSDAVINLAGASIFDRRWTKTYKEKLFESRILTTRKVVKYIGKTKEKPKVFISSSAIGYYGATPSDKVLIESSPSGFDFLAQLCTAWENEANAAKTLVKRIVNLRTGIVLSNKDGALKGLIKSNKYNIGTYFKPGTQYFSWIHIEDLTYAILECIENRKLNGAVNLATPNPVTNKDLSNKIKEVYGAKIVIPIPQPIARIVLGEFAENLIKGQRVIPQALQDVNFVFKYPELLPALKDLKE